MPSNKSGHLSSWQQIDEDFMHGNEDIIHDWMMRNVTYYKEMNEYIPGNEDEENLDLYPGLWQISNSFREM